MAVTDRPAKRLRGVNRFLDERIKTQGFLKSALDHIFPDNWSFMLGEVAFYCFVLLVLSGVYLTFYFDPSDTQVVYQGSYLPLHGVAMSSAYESTVRISLEVRAGLLFRQVHHWAADVFLAAIVVHLCRIFFTGAFRKPRDINWFVGLTMFLLALFNGFTGYSLPDDLMSGLGLRISYSIALSVPIIGNWLAYLLFGGQFPSDQLTHRLYMAHILIVPALIAALLAVHLALIWRQKHTQFPGRGRNERHLVGSQLWPTYAARSMGLFCAVTGLIFILGATVQINPIWLYGPYNPYSASIFAQPDWYVGWLEGALRLFPAWRLHLFGYTVSELFWPAVVLPITTFIVLYSWPALERRVTHDHASHNVLDRPRDRPVRTALGVAGLTLYIVLTLAGAQDIIASVLGGSQPPVTLGLRGMAVVLPVLTGLMAWRTCRDLAPIPPERSGEPPEGPASSAKPPVEAYLPPSERVRRALSDGGPSPVEEKVGALMRTGAKAAVAAGAAGAVGAGWLLRRLSDGRGNKRRGPGHD